MNRFLKRFADQRPEFQEGPRLLRAIILILLALCIGIGVTTLDIFLHRGIESGAEQPIVAHATGRDLAINVDLTRFPADQLESVATILQTNGYRYVRQSFAWAEIEPERGEFVWDRHDQIVNVLAASRIQVVAVLHRSPAWARAPEHQGIYDAPPQRVADYANFVGSVGRHFQTGIQFVQLWDLPNKADHWGGTAAQPADYAALLAEAFNASRTANPETKVVLAEMQSQDALGGTGADVRFLRELYRFGSGPFFDIVAARIDGGDYSPYDRRMRVGRSNLSRAIYFRELLIEQGNAGKPIWLTHYGWDAAGSVTRQEQADFTVAGLKRARAEWPWMGLMFAWGLLPQTADAGEAGFAILTEDGQATETFSALAAYAETGGMSTASTGFVPMDSLPVTYRGNWDDQHLNRQTFRTTGETGAAAVLTFRGNGVTAFLRRSPQAGPVLVTIDGRPVPGWPTREGASVIDLTYFQAEDIPILLADDLGDAVHVLELRHGDQGQLTIGGLVVSREPPLLWPIIVLGLMALLMAMAGLRDLVYVVALRSGALQRRRGVDLRPPLPQLPDWQPATRFR